MGLVVFVREYRETTRNSPRHLFVYECSEKKREREREMASHLLLTRDRCFGRLRNILRW